MAPYDHDRSGDDGQRGGTGPRCPICKAPVAAQHKPFCSKRCADVDLHRWLGGVYSVPTNETPDEAEDKKEAPPR